VIKNLFQINMANKDTVQEVALLGKEKVYNLSTKFGMYYANGLLVSNCDAVRYGLMSLTDLPIRYGGSTEMKILKRQYMPRG